MYELIVRKVRSLTLSNYTCVRVLLLLSLSLSRSLFAMTSSPLCYYRKPGKLVLTIKKRRTRREVYGDLSWTV